MNLTSLPPQSQNQKKNQLRVAVLQKHNYKARVLDAYWLIQRFHISPHSPTGRGSGLKIRPVSVQIRVGAFFLLFQYSGNKTEPMVCCI